MKLLLNLLCLFVLFSCDKSINITTPPYTNTKNEVEYAQNFKIFKQKKYTEIQIINPENKCIEKRLICYSREQCRPTQKTTAIYIQTPIKGFICLSSTQIGMLNKINALTTVKGLDNPNYISNKFILNKVKKQQISVVGNIETINPESITKTKADILMYSGFGKAIANERKFMKLQITPIANYDWKESDPLGKAEWIKFFGILTNKSKEANTYFNRIKKEYTNLKTQAQKLPFSNQLLSGSLIGDNWYMPAGESYLGKLFSDAKINYVAKQTKGIGSYSISLEKVIRSFQNATYWINPGAPSRKELLAFNKRYANFNALKKNNTYCYSQNQNFFWENSAIEPHKLLNDLIIISHPNEYHGKLYFYKKLKNV